MNQLYLYRLISSHLILFLLCSILISDPDSGSLTYSCLIFTASQPHLTASVIESQDLQAQHVHRYMYKYPSKYLYIRYPNQSANIQHFNAHRLSPIAQCNYRQETPRSKPTKMQYISQWAASQSMFYSPPASSIGYVQQPLERDKQIPHAALPVQAPRNATPCHTLLARQYRFHIHVHVPLSPHIHITSPRIEHGMASGNPPVLLHSRHYQ